MTDWLLHHLIVGVALFLFATLGFIGAPLMVWTIAVAVALFALGIGERQQEKYDRHEADDVAPTRSLSPVLFS